MAFNQPTYLAFLFAVLLLTYLVRPGLPRVFVVTIASYFFYFMLAPSLLPLLCAMTLISYVGGLAIEKLRDANRTSGLFVVLILVLLTPLIYYKYAHLLLPYLPSRTADMLRALGVALPIGISFYTLLIIGYLTDIHVGVQDTKDGFWRHALFVSFFPTVSAGPIERGHHLLPQLALRKHSDASNLMYGVQTICLGLLMKIVFSDEIGEPVSTVYANIAKYDSIDYILATIFFLFSAYADFAGYSLIAIGSAKMFGVDLVVNFRQPFLSRSIPEFWRTWHISLLSWLRDYVFIPLRTALRRNPSTAIIIALLVSFTLSGVWHGAEATFVVFGFLQGTLVVVSTLTLSARTRFFGRTPLPKRVVDIGRVFATFSLITLSFILFRAASLTDAAMIYEKIFSTDLLHAFCNRIRMFGVEIAATPFHWWSDATLWIAVLIGGDILARNNIDIRAAPIWAQLIVFNMAIALILYKLATQNAAVPFLYFGF
jgi:alginate O-acetyltransferase complex protein AlgI